MSNTIHKQEKKKNQAKCNKYLYYPVYLSYKTTYKTRNLKLRKWNIGCLE